MDFPHPALPALPRAFTTRQAVDAGLSRQQVRRLVALGELTTPYHGVLALKTDQSLTCRVTEAAPALPPGSAFSRRTAAELFGIDPRTPSEHGLELPLECTVPAGSVPVRYRDLRSFAAPLPPDDVIVVDGARTTSPDRTAADLLRWLPSFMALAVADAMAHLHLISLPAVAAILERYPGGRNIARARRLLAAVDPRTESYGESWQRLRLLDAGFPAPEVQIPILDRDGREIYRLDMGYPELMVGFEYDGVEFHDGREQRIHDEERREDLRKRFGWNAIGCHRGDILGRSMAFELAVGDILGLSPIIYRRSW